MAMMVRRLMVKILIMTIQVNLVPLGLWGIQIQKEVKSNPKQPICKKRVWPSERL